VANNVEKIRTKTVAWARGATAARERRRREESIVMFFERERTNGKEKKRVRDADSDDLQWKVQEMREKKKADGPYIYEPTPIQAFQGRAH
jgi:hypothetical protein